jgi:hypothetical protein
MVTARQSSNHSALNLVPSAHHLVVTEAKAAQTRSAYCGIPRSVRLELVLQVVVTPAVDLDHEPTSDEKVDPTDGGQRHLTPRADAEAEHPDVEESFDA